MSNDRVGHALDIIVIHIVRFERGFPSGFLAYGPFLGGSCPGTSLRGEVRAL
jgi:hypothetical protein